MGIFDGTRFGPNAGIISDLIWIIGVREREIADIDKKLQNYDLNDSKNPLPPAKPQMLLDRRALLSQKNKNDRARIVSLSPPLL